MPDEYPNIFSQSDSTVPLTKWDRDRIAAERAEADRRDAAALRDTRAFNPASPSGRPLTAFERAQGRGQQVSSEPVSRAAQDLPDPPAARPPAGIPRTASDEAGLIDRGTLLGDPNAPSQRPAPAPAPTRPAVRPPSGQSIGERLGQRNPQNPRYVPPDPYDTAGAAINVAGGAAGGGAPSAAGAALRPDLFPHHPDDTHPASGEQPEPFQHHPDDTHPASGGDDVGIEPPDQRRLSNSTPRSIEFPPSNPPPKGGSGGGGGGGGGGAGGRGGAGGAARGRLPLGDQRRNEAYDPTLDRADPRNIGIIDDSGRTNPKLNEQAQKGAIDPTAPGVKTGEAAQKFTNQYTKALAGAATYMEDMFHQKPGDPNKAEGYGAMTLKAVGAPDDALANGVFKVVDPNNELTIKERMELATRAMHDWYSSKGDTKNADKVAAEMLQYGNKQAQAAGKQVLLATKQGDQAGAAKALQEAYDWLPDGMTAQVKGGNLVVTNNKGEVVNNLPLGGNMLQNLGIGLASGTLFWDIIQHRAGKPGTFAPPTPQPQQAITPGAPTGAPAGAPAGVGSPTPQAASAPPVQAPPSAPAPGAGAPAGPPSAPASAPASPASPGSPPIVPPVTPQGNRPVPSPPIPPPQNNQPSAPAPAAPGPTNTSEAAPETAPVDQRTGEPVVQGDQPGISGASRAERADRGDPIVIGAPPPRDPVTAPKAVETKVPPRLSGDAGEPKKTGGTQPLGTIAQPPAPTSEDNLIRDKDDPDAVPKTRDGKPNIVRRSTYPMSDDVKVAQSNINQINKRYINEKNWLATQAGNSKSKQFTATHNDYQRSMDAKYKADLKEQQDVIKEWRTEARAHDAQEKKDLTWTPLKGEERREALEAIDAKLEARVKEGNKWKLYDTNPLRLYNTKEKWAPVRDAVVAIQALNPKIPTGKLTDLTLTMMSHLNSDDAAKGQSANGYIGPKGSRFLVLGEDLARNPVVAMGAGNSHTQIHVPRDTLNDIKRLRAESHNDANPDPEIAKEEARKKAVDRSTYVPKMATDIYGARKADVDRWTKDAPERTKATDVKPSVTMKPPDSLTPGQRLEWERQQKGSPDPSTMTPLQRLEYNAKRQGKE